MIYALVFVFGYLSCLLYRGKDKQCKPEEPVIIRVTKRLKRINDEDFDRVKSMLDDVILKLDDIQGNGDEFKR